MLGTPLGFRFIELALKKREAVTVSLLQNDNQQIRRSATRRLSGRWPRRKERKDLMPFIEMYVTEGALDDDGKRTLHERVSRTVLEAEGASYDDSELAQAITWMLIHEIPATNWSMTDKKRNDIVATVNAEVVNVLGEEFTDPTKSFCLIDEMTFSGGPMVVTFEQLVELLDLPQMLEDEEAEPAPAR
jgi:phenylpyruvate tautomerase PptA (4-oxalocrotonate tautomerase family)